MGPGEGAGRLPEPDGKSPAPLLACMETVGCVITFDCMSDLPRLGLDSVSLGILPTTPPNGACQNKL